MKLRNILYFAGGLLLLSSVACSHEEIDLYSGPKAGIFIQEVASTAMSTGLVSSYRDSVDFSFVSYSAETKETPYRFIVRTIGNVTDYPRRYSLVVDEKATTGVEGVHYSMSRNDYIIYPGQATDTVIVTLLRPEELRTKPAVMKFRLEANENFDIIFDHYKNSGAWNIDGDTLCAVTFAIRTSETYNKPSYWGWFGDSYFGTFSATRMLELEKVMGWTYSDWQSGGSSNSKVQYGRMTFAAKAFQAHLQEMADAGTPVYDEDGSLMQLPGSYAVDYSAYE